MNRLLLLILIATTLFGCGTEVFRDEGDIDRLAELTEGLVVYWPLDGNGNDESGNGKDAQLEKGAKCLTTVE